MDITGVVTELGQLELWRLGDDEVASLAVQAHGLSVAAQAVVLGAAAELERRGTATRVGAASTRALLAGSCRVNAGTAGWWVELGVWLQAHPAVAGSLAAGSITVDHVRVIADVTGRLPKDLPAEGVAACEAFLLDAAAVDDPNALRRRGVELVAHLVQDTDPDPTEEVETAAVARRQVWINSTAVDGLVGLRGYLDVEAAELLRSALSPLSAPVPGPDGEPDTRSAPRRAADALVDLVGRACEHRCVPGEGYVRPHITVTVHAADLTTDPDPDTGPDDRACPECATRASSARATAAGGTAAGDGTGGDTTAGAGNGPGADVRRSVPPGTIDALRQGRARAHRRRGLAQLTHFGPLSRAAARRLACDAEITPITLDTHQVPLDVERSTYTVTGELRRALIARDHGCAFPGCGRPPGWCHAHHIRHWADGGPTALTNLVLVCGFHHRTIHHGGWQVTLGTDAHPWFTPPPWIDPTRTPRPAHTRRPQPHLPDVA